MVIGEYINIQFFFLKMDNFVIWKLKPDRKKWGEFNTVLDVYWWGFNPNVQGFVVELI